MKDDSCGLPASGKAESRIMIVAGEVSGDMHGGLLARALRERSPGIKLTGMGGREMAAAGVKLYEYPVERAVVGFFEVLKNLAYFRRAFRLITGKLETERPDLVVLIDYPGFNLRFAREIKKRKIPLVYYISPQVWAWGEDRVRLIKRCVDRMLCILPFEENFYRERGVPAVFVGHPLFDHLPRRDPRGRAQVCGEFKLDPGAPVIALLPGSRESEVRQHLPLMLAAAERIKKELPSAQFAVLRPAAVPRGIYDESLRRSSLPVAVIENRIQDGLAIARLALVCSGTATLETCLAGVPMVIIYRLSFFTWLGLRQLVKIPHIGMVNIIAGKRVVPELVQYDARPERIAAEALKILGDPAAEKQIREELLKVKEKLGGPGASRRAADIIMEIIEEGLRV